MLEKLNEDKLDQLLEANAKVAHTEVKTLNEFQVPFNPEVNSENNWANPDIRPNRFDGTFENWFMRIGNWGTISIKHSDPINRIYGQEITKDRFIRLMSISDFDKLYSQFSLELRGINELDFIRTFQGADGKMYQEVFKIKVKLKKELTKGFHWWDGLFG